MTGSALLMALLLAPAPSARALGGEERRQAQWLKDCLGAAADRAPYSAWFSGDGDSLTLTEAGRAALDLPLSALPCGAAAPRAGAAAPQAPALRLDERFLASAAAPDFDGSGPATAARPLRLSLVWGTAPRADVHARNLDSLYTLIGRGSEALTGLAAGDDPASAGGVLARGAKMLALDAPLAYVFMIAGHEAGHLETAHMVGGKGLGWVPEGTWGERALGHSYRVEDYSHVSPTGELAIISAGINASQTAAAELRREYLGRDRIDWSFFPQWLANKADLTGYVLAAPKPSNARTDDENGRDPVMYERLYGKRSGQDPDAVHGKLIGGAIWNAFDPMNALALYGYFARHLAAGEPDVPNPMVRIGGNQWGLGTGFWLSEVGPQFALHVLGRDPDNGQLLEVAPSVGDDGQWSVAVSAAQVPLTDWLRIKAGFSVWRQRAHAEPGPKSFGGSADAGLGVKVLKGVEVEASGGYKTSGASLGKPFESGLTGLGGLNFEL